MRRLVLFAVLPILAVVAGCGAPGHKETTPTPVTVVGKLPKPSTPVANAAAGKAVFVTAGCGACHIFTPAGTTGKIGPNLDHLAAYAKAANQELVEFTKTSIVDPEAYIAPGYPKGVMLSNYGTSLSSQQLADLVAFLVKGP